MSGLTWVPGSRLSGTLFLVSSHGRDTGMELWPPPAVGVCWCAPEKLCPSRPHAEGQNYGRITQLPSTYDFWHGWLGLLALKQFPTGKRQPGGGMRSLYAKVWMWVYHLETRQSHACNLQDQMHLVIPLANMSRTGAGTTSFWYSCYTDESLKLDLPLITSELCDLHQFT